MRALALVVAITGCGGAGHMATEPPPGAASPAAAGPQPGTAGANESAAADAIDDDAGPPAYARADLDRALDREHAALAATDTQLAALAADEQAGDALRVTLADRAVRTRFTGTLETCRDTGHHCPPRLDDRPLVYDPDSDRDPKLDVPLRFDLADWRAVAAELHARACACRTQACLDALDALADGLETRPMPQVAADEVAIASLTRARTCLMRLRGRR